MKLSRIMTHGFEAVRPHATLAEAAEKMAREDIGALPVCAEGGEVIGMVTDRDITVRAVASGKDPGRTKVEDVMTPEVISCPEDVDAEKACRLMEERRVRRLLVTDGGGKPRGIVSLGDLAYSLREKKSGEVLKKVSEPD
jgi:CBS domain-containing protein